MVIPFSNTKLRVPKGFQSLLVGLSTEVLRSQPRNIHEFAADYFEKLLKRRDQGQSYLPEQQTSLEDRYYNNQSFQEEYPVNDPEVNDAATKIQAKFRGHKARRDVEKMKQQENQTTIDTDQQDLGYGREQSAVSSENTANIFEEQEKEISKEELEKVVIESPAEFPTEFTEEEIAEQDRAARAIQARFRGQKSRSPRQQMTPDADVDKSSRPSSARIDNDRQDLGGNITGNDQSEPGDNQYSNRPGLEREPTQLSEDFERHTQVPHDSDFQREVQADLNNEQDDMDDPNFEKAATRIQASFRGYKTRKELGSGSTHDQPQISTSPPPQQDEYDDTNTRQLSPSAEENKGIERVDQEEEEDDDDDDNAAAIKIQAAFRGFKVRKELEK